MSKATAAQVTTAEPHSPCATAIAIREKAKVDTSSVIVPDTDVTIPFIQGMLAKFKVESSIDEDGEPRVCAILWAR